MTRARLRDINMEQTKDYLFLPISMSPGFRRRLSNSNNLAAACAGMPQHIECGSANARTYMVRAFFMRQ